MRDPSPRNRAYLVLGSNIAPERNLPAAVRALRRWGNVGAVSSVWQSPALSRPEQADYLNAAVILETRLTASGLLREAIPKVERELGRTWTDDKFASRTIDIDLVLFNHEVLDVDGHHLPSPEILARAFVARPLAEIAPDYVHPEAGRALEEIARTLGGTGLRRREDVLLLRDQVPNR